jgi:hypothetical protein
VLDSCYLLINLFPDLNPDGLCCAVMCYAVLCLVYIECCTSCRRRVPPDVYGDRRKEPAQEYVTVLVSGHTTGGATVVLLVTGSGL